MKKIFNPTTVDELLASKPEVKNTTISEVMALQDGPIKKFYLVKYIRQTQPKRTAGIVLKRSSCQDLVAVFLFDQTLDDSIILNPIN